MMIRSIFQGTANHLVGGDVRVKFSPPPPPYQWGSCEIQDGKAIISIDPGLDWDDLVKVFLHECAHARQFQPSRTVEADPNPELVNHWENKAEGLAGEWLEWGRSRMLGGSWLGVILELQEWT
jgi:hypothetical protein